MVDLTTLAAYAAVVLGFVFIPGPATLLTLHGQRVREPRWGSLPVPGSRRATCFILSWRSSASRRSSPLRRRCSASSNILAQRISFTSAFAQSLRERRPIRRPAPCDPCRQGIRQAILAEVLNPKTALFFLAFLPQFVRARKRFKRCFNWPYSGKTVFVVLGLFRAQ